MKTLIAYLFGAVLSFLSLLLCAWVTKDLYNTYLTGFFDAEPIGQKEAIGISLILMWLKYRSISVRDYDAVGGDVGKSMAVAFTNFFVLAYFCLYIKAMMWYFG